MLCFCFLFNSAKEQDVLNIMGAMYAAILFLGIFNSSTVLAVVGIERVVFYREKVAGMYSALPYAFAQVTKNYSPLSICLR